MCVHAYVLCQDFACNLYTTISWPLLTEAQNHITPVNPKYDSIIRNALQSKVVLFKGSVVSCLEIPFSELNYSVPQSDSCSNYIKFMVNIT